MTMTKQIKDASVRHMGVRIHAKRPTLPIFAVVVVLSCCVIAVNQAKAELMSPRCRSLQPTSYVVAIVNPRSPVSSPVDKR
jgi:hypothetical protein